MKNVIIKLLTLTAFFMLGVSCQNELNEPTPSKPDTIKPVWNPTISAWSGDQTLLGYSIYSTKGQNSPDSWAKWQSDTRIEGWPNTTDRGEAVSTSEYNEVMAYLAAHPNEGYDEVDLSTYFLQNVGSAGHQYTTTPDQNGATHTTGMQMDYFEINGWHVNDFNAQQGPRIYVENWPLKNCTYHDSFGNNTFGYYKFYYIPLSDGTVGLYLCFDYATMSQQGDVAPDGTYDDWVIKIVPGQGETLEIPGTGTDKEEEEGNNKEEICDDEVEVNLSILDEHPAYLVDGIHDLAAKLSIHVRYAGDVEIFIPVPAEYYVAKDDLDIVLSHKYGVEEWGEESRGEYIINGTPVSITVTFEENGIRVRTDGITDAVLNYCRDTYGDGVNFEVWLYFNDSELFQREQLQNKLNKSTVEFLDGFPGLYVNAFGKIAENIKTPGDCIVSIVERQAGKYQHQGQGEHLNDSPYNEIWKVKE